MHVVKIYVIVTLLLILVLESAVLLGPLLRQIGVLAASLVLGWWLSLGIKHNLSSRHKVSPEGLAVVVAGCDSEHGFLTASQLRCYGYYVLAGTQHVGGAMARGMEKLKVEVVQLQPSNEGSVNDAFQDISERLLKEEQKTVRVLVLWCAEKRLHALVCNVGSGDLGELEWISDLALRRALDETVVFTARLVNRFLPLLRASRGRVVICAGSSDVLFSHRIMWGDNVTSEEESLLDLYRRVAVPGAGVHSVVNSALIAYAECLRREMFKFMVQVTLIEPVWINYRTPLSHTHSPGVIIKEVLSDLSREVFEDYSLCYANAFRTLWNCRATRWYEGPPDILAAHTCRAVNDRMARPVYACGYPKERVTNEVLDRLPSHIADIAQCFVYQPFAKQWLFSEADDGTRGGAFTREPIASPGYLQRLLCATLSPEPVQFRASEMSTPARELQTLKAEYFASSDTSDDVTPPPKTPSPVARVKGEEFKPRHSHDLVNTGNTAGTGEQSPLPGAEQAQVFSAPPPTEQTVPQSGGSAQPSVEDATSSDATASPELRSGSQNTASSASSAKESSSRVTLPVDEDISAVLLDAMEENECDLVASTLASTQHTARENRVHLPYACGGTQKVVARSAALAPPQELPPPVRQEMPLSPRSPYDTGIQPLPSNFMDLISPPTVSDRTSSSTSTTGEEHSRSPIDSAIRIEVVPAPSASQPQFQASLLPDSSGPPLKFIAPRHAEYLRKHRMTGQAEADAKVVDSDQKDSAEEPSMSGTDHQDRGSLRHRRTTKDPEEPPQF